MEHILFTHFNIIMYSVFLHYFSCFSYLPILNFQLGVSVKSLGASSISVPFTNRHVSNVVLGEFKLWPFKEREKRVRVDQPGLERLSPEEAHKWQMPLFSFHMASWDISYWNRIYRHLFFLLLIFPVMIISSSFVFPVFLHILFFSLVQVDIVHRE